MEARKISYSKIFFACRGLRELSGSLINNHELSQWLIKTVNVNSSPVNFPHDPASVDRDNATSPRLRLRLLGPMAGWNADGQHALPRGRKTRAVLAVLALTAPKPVLRTHLTGLLWSQRMPAQARGSLRQSVHELQDLLAAIGGPRLHATRETLALEQDGLEVDARESDVSPDAARDLLADLTGLDPAFDIWLAEERAARSTAPQPVSADRSASAGQKLRFGVMPPHQQNGSGIDPLSLGLAEEITSALARFRWIECVDPASLARLIDVPRGTHPAWDALALDFLLDGTIQHTPTEAGPRIRLSVRLLDLRAGGAVAWSGRFEPPPGALIDLQDELAAAIAAQLDPELMLRESSRIAARPPVDPTAYELVLRAIPAIQRLDQPNYQQAGMLLEEAVRAAPDFAAAHAWLAYWFLFLVGQGWVTDRRSAMHRAGELAERAVMLDPADARALAIAGHVRGFLYHRMDEAMMLHERAIALNPNLPLALAFSGLTLSYMGAHDAAIARITRYRALSPLDPHAYLFEMALMMPHFLRGDYEHVVEIGRRAILLNPGFSSTHKVLLAALGHLGSGEEAASLRDRLRKIEPDFSIRSALAHSPIRRPEDRNRYITGLRLAGVEE